MREIGIINKSTIVTNDQLQQAVVAIQTQVSTHFEKVWKMDARLFITKDNIQTERIYIMDTSDQKDAEGYHQYDKDIPVGFVFVKTAQADSDNWTATFSHEVLEQIADPSVDLGRESIYHSRPVLLDFEMCDPVENDEYKINDISVSNFLTPQWFEQQLHARGTKFDYLGKLTQPVTLSLGGYFGFTTGGYFGLTTDLRHWHQVTGKLCPLHQVGFKPLERRWRRYKKLLVKNKVK